LNTPSDIKYRVYIGEPSFTHFYVVKMDGTVTTEELLMSMIKHMNLKFVQDFDLTYNVSEFSDEVVLRNG
jgi:hypothetical protein